jgi:hypothetical protein
LDQGRVVAVRGSGSIAVWWRETTVLDVAPVAWLPVEGELRTRWLLLVA